MCLVLIVNNTWIIFAYAVTPVHVGMGRAPGAVDLPFQRDSFGYPIIYGSSFKGTLKSEMISYFVNTNDNNNGGLDKDHAKKLVNCIFGSEPDDENKSMGRFIFTDMIPIFYPIASLNEGYIYVTTEYLISRANDIMELNGKVGKFEVNNNSHDDLNKMVLLRNSKAKGKICLNNKNSITLSQSLERIGYLFDNSSREVYVFDNEVGLQIIESSLIRLTRNVLDDKTKKSENLWTEEYLPQGTILVGAVIDSNRKNESCDITMDKSSILKFLKDNLNNRSIFIGGKETIGKGLIKLRLWYYE